MTKWFLLCTLLSTDATLPSVCNKTYDSAISCTQAMDQVDDHFGRYCTNKSALNWWPWVTWGLSDHP
jgi:hypothetical protein